MAAVTLELTVDEVKQLASALTNQKIPGVKLNATRRTSLVRLLESASGLELGSVALNPNREKKAAPTVGQPSRPAPAAALTVASDSGGDPHHTCPVLADSLARRDAEDSQVVAACPFTYV